tara:strand:+ start:273 stop:482 length:210 start_codon:yes stop_codon:yes gene_type:complete
MAISDYSSHDWRKHTDSAVVVDKNKAMLKVNDCKVYFTDPKDLKDYEVDVSRLIRVFVNNITDHRRSVK